MVCSWIDFEGSPFDELRGVQSRGTNGNDLVVVAMNDQGWNVKLEQIFCEVCLGEGFNAIDCAFEADLHRPEPEHIAKSL